MAEENIERIVIDITERGAATTDQKLKTMEERLERLKRAAPEISKRFKEITFDGGGDSKLPQTLEKVNQEAVKMAEKVQDIAHQWDYLNSPVEILNAKIRRLTDETERYKKAWAESSDTTEQDKLSDKIENNVQKLSKLNAEKDKLESGGGDSNGDFGGLLKNIQSISGLFGKTGGQVAGLIGKADNLKSIFGAVAGAAAKIAIPVALVVGAVKAVSFTVRQIKQTAQTLLKVAKSIATAIGNEIKKKVEGLVEPIQRLKKQIGRVVFNRLVREAFNAVQNGVAEGLQNVAKGFERANAVMSEYSTQMMYLRNTLGAMIIPLLENLYPLFELITNAVIKASNAINQFLSLLAGKNTYIQAKKQYVDYADSIDSSSKKAKKSMSNLVASFDELHDLTESASDTGSDEDMTQFFTSAGIEANVSDFYKRLRDGFKKGNLSSVGVDLANKLNAQLERMIELVKWDNVKDTITTKISAITSGLRSFLKTFINNRGFENVGRTIGSALDTIIQSIATFDKQMQADLITINDTVLNGFGAIGVSIADTVYGFVMSIDWATLGEVLLDKLLNLFDVAKGLTARMLETVVFNGESMTRIEAMVTNVMQGLAGALEEAINGDKFTSLGETIGNMLLTIFKAGAAIFTSSDFWQDLATAVNDVISALVKKMNDPNFLKALTDFVVALVNGAATLLEKSDISGLIEAVTDIIYRLSKDPQIQQAISNLTSAMGDIMWAGIKFKFTIWKIRIETFVNSVINALKLDKIGMSFSFESQSTLARGNGRRSYATGGFPEDGLFYANHNELVGQFSNGKTAVINNGQIIAGVSAGVESGVVRALQSTNSEQRGGNVNLRGDLYFNTKKVGTYIAEDVGKELNRQGFTLRAK